MINTSKKNQEAAEKHERDDNYFDGWHLATNTSGRQQEANFLDQDEYVDTDEEDNVVRVPESGPPQVNYGTEQPLATSTPRATSTSIPETQTTDTYRQIIPGMSECLYPTLIADGSLTTPAADNCSTLQKQITSEIDKYLQEK